jgi:hypothetical protein
VTSPDVPADVVVKLRPPEAKNKVPSSREDSLVTEVVVSVLNEWGTVGRFGNKTGSVVAVLSKKLSFPEEIV